MNRRDIFKLFGAGTVIAPVLDGLPSATLARIVSPPQVELVDAPKLAQPGILNFADDLRNFLPGKMVIYYTTGVSPTGPSRTYRMEANGFATEYKMQPMYFRELSGLTHTIPGLANLTFRVTGAHDIQAVNTHA
jgi:hypothetical protein